MILDDVLAHVHYCVCPQQELVAAGRGGGAIGSDGQGVHDSLPHELIQNIHGYEREVGRHPWVQGVCEKAWVDSRRG
jgi:hypothetical protein